MATVLENLNDELGKRFQKIADEVADIAAKVEDHVDKFFVLTGVDVDKEELKEAVKHLDTDVKLLKNSVLEQQAGPRSGAGGAYKLDLRDVDAWQGPTKQEFNEFAWHFHVGLDGTKAGLGAWARWAVKASMRKEPIEKRTDPKPA